MGSKKIILGLVLILGVLTLSSFVLAERIEITGDHFGDLRVKEGDLVLVNDAFVFGNIRVNGALIVNESSTVLGRIVAKRDSYVLVVNDSRIHGNIVGRGCNSLVVEESFINGSVKAHNCRRVFVSNNSEIKGVLGRNNSKVSVLGNNINESVNGNYAVFLRENEKSAVESNVIIGKVLLIEERDARVVGNFILGNLKSARSWLVATSNWVFGNLMSRYDESIFAVNNFVSERLNIKEAGDCTEADNEVGGLNSGC